MGKNKYSTAYSKGRAAASEGKSSSVLNQPGNILTGVDEKERAVWKEGHADKTREMNKKSK